MPERPIDFVTKIGKIEIPFYTFVETPVKSRDLAVRYTFDSSDYTNVLYWDKEEPAMIVPGPISGLRYSVVHKKLEDNAKTDKPKVMVNGPNYGCLGVYMRNEESATDGKIMIDLRPTWFFDHMGISQSLDVPFSGFGGKTLREFYQIDPTKIYKFLPHVCGNNVSLKSSDGFFIWMNRGEMNVQYPNRKGVPAGFGNHLKDIENGVVSPRMTAVREVGEEAGVSINPDELVLRHIGTPYDDIHTEISWSCISQKMTADEILKAPKTGSKYEGRLFKVPFGLDDLTIKHLKNPNEWVLAHWFVTIQDLIEEYGREKVTHKLNE